MRTISWSRDRCLSWSFVRIGTRLRRRKVGSHTRLQTLRYGPSVLGVANTSAHSNGRIPLIDGPASSCPP